MKTYKTFPYQIYATITNKDGKDMGSFFEVKVGELAKYIK